VQNASPSGTSRQDQTGSAKRLATQKDLGQEESPAVEENVEAIRRWEQAALHSRTRAEQLGDLVTSTAASSPVLIAHVAWFAFWIAANVNLIPGITPFDHFPFPFLTMTVSLEAIFLALFVLASQNRLAQQADKRAHLDLQIDLLAEREMTAVLRLLLDIAAHLDVKTKVTADQIRDLIETTDVHALTTKLDEIPKPGAEEDHQRGGGTTSARSGT
jgi:uncharacterized membrane protein